MFTEADPMSVAPLLVDPIGAPGDEITWGATTYVGRARRRTRVRPDSEPAPELVRPDREHPGPRHAAPEPDTQEPAAGTAAPQRSLLANSRIMAIATFASRLTGFLRNVLLVAALGATSQVSIAYNSGNNLPNMIYELLLGGVLSSVLIPLLVKAEAEDDDHGLAYTQRLFSIATVALGTMTLVAVAAAPWIAAAFVEPG